MEDAAQLFVNPSSYTDETTLEAALALLREKAPVVRVEHPSYRPFWAVTKYADIIEVLRNHELWLNEPRSILQTIELDDALDAMRDTGVGLRNLVHIDGACHRALRTIGAESFRPKVMRSLKHRIDELPPTTSISWRRPAPSANSSEMSQPPTPATSSCPCWVWRKATSPADRMDPGAVRAR